MTLFTKAISAALSLSVIVEWRGVIFNNPPFMSSTIIMLIGHFVEMKDSSRRGIKKTGNVSSNILAK